MSDQFYKCPQCDAILNSAGELRSHVTMSHHHNHRESENTGIH